MLYCHDKNQYNTVLNYLFILKDNQGPGSQTAVKANKK